MDVKKCYKNGLKYLNEGKFNKASKYLDKVIEYYEKKLGIKSHKDYKNLVDKLKNLNEEEIGVFIGAWINREIANSGGILVYSEKINRKLEGLKAIIEPWFDEGTRHFNEKKYEESIKYFDKIIKVYEMFFGVLSDGDYNKLPNKLLKSINKSHKKDDIDKKLIKSYEEFLNYSNYKIYENEKNKLSDLSWSILKGYFERLLNNNYNQNKIKYNKNIELFSYAWNNKGIALARLKKYKEAIECFEKALEINPDFHDTIIDLYQYLKQNLCSKDKIDKDGFIKIFGLLCEIAFYIMDLKKELMVSDKEVIYHYTKPIVIKNLLEGFHFRLYNVSYMNDPEEGKTFLRMIANEKLSLDNLKYIYEIEHELDIQNFKESGEFQAFIGSFVVDDYEGDNLFLWRTYGKDENKEEAKGVCIGIKKDFFDNKHDYLETSKNIGLGSDIGDIFCLYYVIYYEDDETEDKKHSNDSKFEKLKNTLKEIDKLISLLIQELNEINRNNHQKLIEYSQSLMELIDNIIIKHKEKDELEKIGDVLRWVILFKLLQMRITTRQNYYKYLKILNEVTTSFIENNKDKIPTELIKKLEEFNSITCEVLKTYEPIRTLIKSLLDEIRYLVKSKYYKEEKECRVVKVYNLKFHKDKIKLDTNHTPPRLYVEIEKDLREYIKEIILGPKVENKEHWKLYLEYLKNKDPKKYGKIEIKRSNCNFR
ncbi:tetratricopeptide repeat protein [Methanotorris igneus]|uniref:Tetratricopeptide TPR_1 repeat-containing protein n=1 Tax=Methanotorris igneus (strain DSM 5666 / JCM 11834 / Kol 5) TaxID=880724 RepID=F6BF54_METIK|nr:tetratricopeptide repeat protein [Methanotorris igneus]AEF96924.1 Tetratricopeptide TPR_1 repeat-containing protein [Methanotorris igneus Kol 5]